MHLKLPRSLAELHARVVVASGNTAMNIHDILCGQLKCTELQTINSARHIISDHTRRQEPGRNKDMRRSLGRGRQNDIAQGADSTTTNCPMHRSTVIPSDRRSVTTKWPLLGHLTILGHIQFSLTRFLLVSNAAW